MAEIPLTQGKVAIVDDSDFEWLSQWKWNFMGTYAVRRNGHKREWMHRLIAGTPVEMQTDHINQDKLDNCRSNLRICTSRQNNINKGVQKNNKVGLKGVYFRKDRGTWRAKIDHRIIGTYKTPEEAGRAYNIAARKLHKEFAVFNNV